MSRRAAEILQPTASIFKNYSNSNVKKKSWHYRWINTAWSRLLTKLFLKSAEFHVSTFSSARFDKIYSISNFKSLHSIFFYNVQVWTPTEFLLFLSSQHRVTWHTTLGFSSWKVTSLSCLLLLRHMNSTQRCIHLPVKTHFSCLVQR